jgi:flagellar hook-associated protein 2
LKRVVRWLLQTGGEVAMGTVGLSFGSPTSGAGFDVSSTVASIVSNLQKVETPWKTQLTSLQSQDTAISSLGTLFSNLSTDLSSLTDFEGIMAQKTGSSSNANVLELTSASSSATAGTHTVEVSSLAETSSGYLAPVSSASEQLTGSITLKVGASGTAQTITLGSSDNTLAGLAAAINASGVGVTASVLTDSSGSRLSLVSGTSGANGNITVSSNSIAAAKAATLSYTGTAGAGTAYSSGTLTAVANSSDLLTGSISIGIGGGTAQTINLSSSGETLQQLADAINDPTTGISGVTASVVTNNDGSQSLSLESQTAGSAGTLAVTSSITDPVTHLGYTAAVAGADAQLTVDGVSLTSASNTVTGLIPGLTFQLLAPSAAESGGGLEQVQVVIGNDTTDVKSTLNQFVSDYNSLISAVNTQEGKDSSGNPEPLFGSPTLSLLQQQLLSGLNTQNPNGSLDAVAANTDTTLSGSITIQVGSGTAQTVTVDSTDNTLSGLASAINKANIGVTAAVVTSGTQQTLTLLSQTAGTSGALTVSSSISATSDKLLSYTGTAGSSSAASTGTLTSIPSANDALTGSISIKVGSGTAQTITLDSSNNTLSGLKDAINQAISGVQASIVTNGDGSQSLSLVSNTVGSAGTLTVTSKILDTKDTSTAALGYTNSSDVSTLANLGITVSASDNGTLSFDATTLDSVLNSDFSGVVGFFQNVNSWGQSFSTMLSNAGSSSTTGTLSLASNSNSSMESTLNAEISKENIVISTQQASLTAELNSANEIMQELPSQLQGVNELYSAITGYNQSSNG